MTIYQFVDRGELYPCSEVPVGTWLGADGAPGEGFVRIFKVQRGGFPGAGYKVLELTVLENEGK